MNSTRSALLSLLSVAAIVAWAPYTRADNSGGLPAVSAALQRLEARVAALEANAMPTAASLVGIYDAFEVTVDVDGGDFGVSIAGAGSDGTVVFKADGTADVKMTKQYRQLQFNTERVNIGTRFIDSTTVTLRDAPETSDGIVGWTFANGVLTVGDGSFIVVGRLLIGRILSTDGSGQNGLVMLARRLP